VQQKLAELTKLDEQIALENVTVILQLCDNSVQYIWSPAQGAQKAC
jgi:hypothetical protein